MSDRCPWRALSTPRDTVGLRRQGQVCQVGARVPAEETLRQTRCAASTSSGATWFALDLVTSAIGARLHPERTAPRCSE